MQLGRKKKAPESEMAAPPFSKCQVEKNLPLASICICMGSAKQFIFFNLRGSLYERGINLLNFTVIVCQTSQGFVKIKDFALLTSRMCHKYFYRLV